MMHVLKSTRIVSKHFIAIVLFYLLIIPYIIVSSVHLIFDKHSLVSLFDHSFIQ